MRNILKYVCTYFSNTIFYTRDCRPAARLGKFCRPSTLSNIYKKKNYFCADGIDISLNSKINKLKLLYVIYIITYES